MPRWCHPEPKSPLPRPGPGRRTMVASPPTRAASEAAPPGGSMRRLLLVIALAPALALADDPPSAAGAEDPFPRFGLSAAVGVPDGAVLNGVFRPLDFRSEEHTSELQSPTNL